MHTRAGAHVDHVVRRADGLLVVFHHEHRIAEVAEPEQGIEEPAVVALVQADARFIQDVQHAHEGRADLRGEPDALALAARERGRAAVEREVVQAHVDHEPEALADLLQYALGNGGLFFRERKVLKKREGLFDAHARDIVDVQPGDLDRQRFLAQPAALAVRAGLVVHVLFHLPLDGVGIGLIIPPFQALDDAFEGFARRALARCRGLRLALGVAVQQHLLLRRLQVLERGVHVETAAFRKGVEHFIVVDRGALCPGFDRAFAEREVGVRDDEPRIELQKAAEAVAGGAGALGAVEGEGVGGDLGIADVVDDAGELLAVEQVFLLVHKIDEHEAFGLAEGGLDAFREPALDAGLHHKPVDHDLDAVLLFFVHRDRFGKLFDRPVDPGAHIARGARGHELFPVLALASANDRRQDLDARAFGQGHDRIGHLLHGLGRDLPAALPAIGFADAREEQAQVVVHLGHGAHGGAGVLARGLLFDGDGRGEAVDGIHVGLVHLAQELARVGREALDVAALAFGIDGVEGEGRLARARQARDHHELVARDLDVDVL